LPARRSAGSEGVQALRESTGAAVKRSLLALDIADLDAGYQPGRGYVHECDAAAELVEQAIEPFEEDARRRLRLGLTEAAQALALGVLDGLEACEGSYDGDEVLCYAGRTSPMTMATRCGNYCVRQASCLCLVRPAATAYSTWRARSPASPSVASTSWPSLSSGDAGWHASSPRLSRTLLP
jgi:hypothetical protein